MHNLNDQSWTYVAFVVLSAEQDNRPADENARRTSQLRRELTNHTRYVAPVVGSYEGVQENSFLVAVDRSDGLTTRDVEEIARSFGQESILVLSRADDGAERDAALLFTDDPLGRRHPLGKFRHVSEKYAKAQPAFTYLPSHDLYFVAE